MKVWIVYGLASWTNSASVTIVGVFPSKEAADTVCEAKENARKGQVYFTGKDTDDNDYYVEESILAS